MLVAKMCTSMCRASHTEMMMHPAARVVLMALLLLSQLHKILSLNVP